MALGDKPTTPGQAGSAKMDIFSAAGHKITGIPVRFTAAGGASLTAAGRSGEWKAFTRISPSPVRISGTATVASAQVIIGTAPHGQTLISAFPVQVTAQSGYQNHPGGVKSAVRCDCDGTGNVTGTISQAAGSAEGRYAMLVDGKARVSVTIPAGRHRQAADLKATAPDGAVVTFTARYRIAGRWTPPVFLAGTFTVHCPAMPRVTFTARCNCAPGTGTYADKAAVTVTDPSAAWTDTVTYTVNGAKHTVTVAPGASKTTAVTVPPGTVSFGWSWTASA